MNQLKNGKGIVALFNRRTSMAMALLLGVIATGCTTTDSAVTAPKIVAGAAHACAFDVDREQVVCWGDNSYGQLGNEEFSAEGVSAPVRVKVISGRKIKSLSAGYSHTCALVSGGDDDTKNTVACWGYNHYGQVGNGTFNDSNVPVFVNGPDGNPLTGVVNLSAGAYHTCASIVKGSPSDPSNYVATTYCWGRNDKGQIGNGALTNVNVPTEIKGLDYSGGVAAGTAHTCALTSKSTDDAQAKKYVVMCWGDASHGQMRDAKVEGGYTAKPVDIGLPLQGDDDGFPALFSEHVVQADVTTATGKPVKKDAAAAAPETPAYGQTCAITADQVQCWGGTNQNGQWGTDKKDVTEFAVKTEEIVSGSKLKAYGAGNAQSCMLVGKGDDSSANEVACWGYSSSLGFNMPADATDAVVASNRQAVTLQGTRPTGIAVGREFVCYAAKGEQPQIWCWGTGKKGQIGNATTASTRVPVCVKGYCPETKASDNLAEGQPFAEAPGAAPTALQLSASYNKSCMVASGGKVYCWGVKTVQKFDLRGDEYDSAEAVPIAKEISGLNGGALSVSAGLYNGCAVVAGGVLKCFGDDFVVSFTGSFVDYHDSPYTPFGFGANVKEAFVSAHETCATFLNNSLKCFANIFGPGRPVRQYDGVKQIVHEAAGDSQCVLYLDGSVKCQWRGTDFEPVADLGSGVQSIAAGQHSFCAVIKGGGVKCWREADQLYDVAIHFTAAETISGLPAVKNVALGEAHTCVLTSAGGVKCWGQGNYGELGNGTFKDSSTPVDVQGLPFGVLAIAAGYSHNCALLLGGVVKCWGRNNYGQLGDGTTQDRSIPVVVSFGGQASIRGEVAVKSGDLLEGQSQQKVTVTIPTVDGDLAYAFDCDNDGTYEINGEVAGHECFYNKLSSGTYDIGYKIRVKNLFNESDVTGKVTFSIANMPPVISSVQSDSTVISAGSNAAKTFTVSSVTASDPGGDALTYAYDCNFDGAIDEPEIQSRTNAVCDLSTLTPGTYSLRVVVTDADHETQGNGQTIKPVTITITSPADTQIVTTPPEYASAATATFTFSSPQTDTIEYKLDTAAFAVTTTGAASYTALTDGTHTFTARAVMGGFAGVATSYTWIVDTVGPMTVSDTTFTQPVGVDTVSVQFHATDLNAAGGFTYQCQLDGGSWSTCYSGDATGPVSGEGLHTLVVSATDVAGNPTTSPAMISWYYWIPPVTTLDPSGPAEGSTVNQNTGTFTFSSPTATGFECQLDTGAWTACTSPYTTQPLGDGTHTVAIRAVRNGVPDTTSSTRTFTVDTTPPDTTITASYATDASTSGDSYNIEFSCGGEAGCSFECKVDTGSFATCTSPYTALVSTEGSHTASVRALDTYGNPDTTPAIVNWTVTFPSGGGGGSASAVTSVAAGTQHSCIVTGNGSLYCWGDNMLGQLGDPVAAGSTPSLIGSSTWRKVASNGNADHTCGIQSDSTLWCWGFNNFSQLGDGTQTIAATPTQIGAATWRDIDTGQFHSCGIQADGTLWCWGDDFQGKTGTNSGSTVTSPTQVGTASNWVTVGLGASHSCAINATGELYCWGADDNDQIGNGAAVTDVLTPVKIGTDTDWAQVDGGYAHTCAVKTGGTLYCWGSELDGQNGTGANQNVPTQVGTDTDWAYVATGALHTCAIKTTGALWCWGSNTYGQLGNGDTSGVSAAPAQIGTASNWLVVGGGHSHSIGIQDNAGTNAPYGWGDNQMGQVGDPSASADSMTPAYSPFALTLP